MSVPEGLDDDCPEDESLEGDGREARAMDADADNDAANEASSPKTDAPAKVAAAPFEAAAVPADVVAVPRDRAPVGDLRPPGRQPRIRRAMSTRTRNVLSWAQVLVAAVLLAVLMRTFLIAAFSIPSESMEPVLAVGDRLLVSKLSYRIGDPDPGDVVVFRTPPSMQPSETAELIKRVVAIGGQTVGADNGQLVVDGSSVDEEYLPADTYTRDFGPLRVPEGYVFVMGDNRRSSLDSRVFGAIAEGEIVGRAFARFWPPTRLGGL